MVGYKGYVVTAEQHAQEVASGDRFRFGENWSRYLAGLNDTRIRAAETSLLEKLGPLRGKSFLDIGSGSGLFSLAARRLGATVHSFDYDPQSVACALELKRRYFPEDPGWKIEQGSALDAAYMAGLGRFDVVYSWGVLHHTGAMWQALGNAAGCVKDPGGLLFVAIYNDQGKTSRRWTRIKKLYNKAPGPLKMPIAQVVCVELWWRRWAKDLLRLRPFESWRNEGKERGMTAWRDVIDWVGGYPFEVAKPEEIFNFYRDRGFTLEKMTTQGFDLGCNEFVFKQH